MPTLSTIVADLWPAAIAPAALVTLLLRDWYRHNLKHVEAD